MDSCRGGWNVQNGLNLIKILDSVGESVDFVLLLALVLVLIVRSCTEQKALQMSLLQKVHKPVDFTRKKWLYGLLLMPKHSCCQSKK